MERCKLSTGETHSILGQESTFDDEEYVVSSESEDNNQEIVVEENIHSDYSDDQVAESFMNTRNQSSNDEAPYRSKMGRNGSSNSTAWILRKLSNYNNFSSTNFDNIQRFGHIWDLY